jgi:pimeloyl-ACP methyl ester carboxylesterase
MISVDGIDLCVETFGDSDDAAVLLISGLGASMDWWNTELCALLAGAGRHVIRYDHRDTGRSTSYAAGEPKYTGADLTVDALRVLDGLAIERAHLVGVSAGGGIAQELAAEHAERVLSITLIATSPAGHRVDPTELPPPEPHMVATFEHPAPKPNWDDRSAVVSYLVDDMRPYSGAVFDEEQVRRVATVIVDRTVDIEASVTNYAMIDHGPDAEFRVADITVPALVLHGTEDPLFPLAHGHALTREIPTTTFIPLEGMGHEVPPPEHWPMVVPAIIDHTSHGHGA